MLYEKRIEDVLNEWHSSDVKLASTTVFMPEVMRLGLSELKEKHNVSIKFLVERVVAHGHSIIQHKYSDDIKVIEKGKSELRYAEVRPFRNFNELRVSIDGMERPVKKYIHVIEGVLASIREIMGIVGIEQSSFIRICIFYSLSTSEEINKEVIEKSKSEVKVFEKRIKQNIFVYKILRNGEKEWKKEEKNIKT